MQSLWRSYKQHLERRRTASSLNWGCMHLLRVASYSTFCVAVSSFLGLVGLQRVGGIHRPAFSVHTHPVLGGKSKARGHMVSLRFILMISTHPGIMQPNVAYCILSRNRVCPRGVHNIMQWVPHGVYHGHIYFPVSPHGINAELF